MTEYAMKITAFYGGVENTIFSKPLKSETHLKKLEKKLILDDTTFSRFTNYFTETKKALKIENVITRIFSTFFSFFSDVITWPSSYKTRFLENIPLHQYLLKKGLDEGFLFSIRDIQKNIYFYTKEEKGGGAAGGCFDLTRKMRSKDATLSNKSARDFFHRNKLSWAKNPDITQLFDERFVYSFSS